MNKPEPRDFFTLEDFYDALDDYMTRGEAKEYFELEDDGECVWIEDTTQYSFNEFIDKIFDSFEQRIESLEAQLSNTKQPTCDGCDYKEAMWFDCTPCSRIAHDYFKPKDTK